MITLSIINKTDPGKVASYLLGSPGATIGSSPDNDLVLSDRDQSAGKVQAICKVNQQGNATLINLSSIIPISVGGISLSFRQEIPVQENDEIIIGNFVLRPQDKIATHTNAAVAEPVAAVMPKTPVIEPQAINNRAPSGDTVWAQAENPIKPPAPAPAPAEDIFADLLNSPGVIPVGSSPQDNTHPFEMASAAERNHPNPVSLLTPQGVQQYGHNDPLNMLSSDGADQHRSSIFSDPRPSTIQHSNALSEHQEDQIMQALEQATYSQPINTNGN